MDIKCRKCGEPWDMDTIHEEIAERFPHDVLLKASKDDQEYAKLYELVRIDFFNRGCAAFLGAKCNPDSVNENKELWETAYAEFGDDLDGIASIMDDMGY